MKLSVHKTSSIDPPGGHLVVAVMVDDAAAVLIRYASQVRSALGPGSWSVVAIDTPDALDMAPEVQRSLADSLEQAESLGARVTRISTGTHAASGAVLALIHRLQSEKADTLLIGRVPVGAPLRRRSSVQLAQFADQIAEQIPGLTVHVVTLRVPAGPDSSQPRARWRARRHLDGAGLVLLTLGLCTALGTLLERYFHPANLVMLFLAGVVFVAARKGRSAAIAMVLGSIAVYDLIFVAPRWSLNPIEPQYWMAFAVMLATGLVISRLVVQGREQAAMAEARAQRADALSQLALALVQSRDEAAVCRLLEQSLQRSLNIEARVLRAEDLSDARSIDRLAGKPVDLVLAREVLRSASEAGPGTARRSDSPLCYLPLRAAAEAIGVVVMEPVFAREGSLEDQSLARALVNQAAIALERARLESQAVQAAVDAQTERMRSTLLAGISHDFRTPLTTIVGNASSLIEQGRALSPAQRHQMLQDLLREAQRLHCLTSDLLDLVGLEEGAIKPALEWCPAEDLITDALSAMGTRLDGHEIEASFAADDLVWCDPRLIGQVLHNLLDNAVRHTPANGRIRVAISVEPGWWRLVVHDSGPGVPAGQEEAVFLKFHRAHRDGDVGRKGLGLAICAAAARVHGGSIRVTHCDGACFEMRLPQPRRPEVEEGELA